MHLREPVLAAVTSSRRQGAELNKVTAPLPQNHLAQRVTVRDVADRAQVSLGTVSNALNRPDLVAPGTLAKVLAAIDELGFVRNSAAYQLRGGRSKSFGAVVLDASNPYFAEALRGLEDVLHDHGSFLVLCSTDGSPEREGRYLRLLEEQRVQGIVITPAERNIDHLTALRSRGIPVVLLDRKSGGGDLCSVSVDHSRGGELAGGHLFDHGHRRIAFINGPLHISQCVERRRGMRRAARRAGLDPERAIVEFTIDPITALGQVEDIVNVIANEPVDRRPTAVACLDDQAALVVLRELAELRIRVPRDISVLGYDDVSFAGLLSPALTSVRQPKYELGRAAAELLIAEAGDARHHHDDVRFEPELVLRDSTTGRSTLNRYHPSGG